MLRVNPDKLTAICKSEFGKTPLKIIHEELLLEVKRLMILNEKSLKEIAFDLNFESQANFSSFVKTATGFTPSELQDELQRLM